MSKKNISIRIDSELYKSLSKRAVKNYLTVDEMVEDIIRRSMLSWRGRTGRRSIKVSKLVAAFSREKRGRKRKSRKKKNRKT